MNLSKHNFVCSAIKFCAILKTLYNIVNFMAAEVCLLFIKDGFEGTSDDIAINPYSSSNEVIFSDMQKGMNNRA